MHFESDAVAVVTGAAGGIGRALAVTAAEHGLRVLLVDLDPQALERTAADLRGRSAGVATLVADVARAEDVDRIADTAFGLGPVQLVCSNAGVVAFGRAWEIPAVEWQQVMNVNFMATVHLVRAFVPRLIEAGRPAHLLVTGSMASVTARPGISPYVAAKHALLGLCETLYREFAEADVPLGVTLLMPGKVSTGMSREDYPEAITPDRTARVAFDAIARNQLFAFTHEDRIAEVDQRFTNIVGQRNP